MKVRTFLDDGKVIELVLDLSDKDIKLDLEGHTKIEDRNIGKNVINNIKDDITVEQTENPDVNKILIKGQEFVKLSKSTGEVENVNSLVGFETRTLGQRDDQGVPFPRNNKVDFSPKTDLHTHFAGALTPESLVKVGIEHNIDYDKELLEKIGIDTNKYNICQNAYGKDCIKVRDLNEEDIQQLKEALKISPVTQETFNKMEDIYSLRGPFTKNKELFPDYLRELANDYKNNGIEYVELSLSSVISSPEDMQMIEDNLPKIEEETGVKIRFLGALWRHSDMEWNNDEIDRLMKVAESPYVVGYDLMGIETNSTLIFEEQLKRLAKYAMTKDPNFAIRLHAGENPIFKDNVKNALKIMLEAHDELEEENGEQCPLPNVRIGHGLYGVDDETIDMAKELGAIIEFNMSSNLALNNINYISDIPIKRYLDAGVEVVLGTDGHGMYSTSSKQEVILATAAGLEPKDYEKIRITEGNVIKRAQEREQSHPRIQDVNTLYGDNVQYKSGEPCYDDDVIEKYKKYNDDVLENLSYRVDGIAETSKEEIKKVTEGKIPIVLTGASKSQWEQVKQQDIDENTTYTTYIALLTQVLANVLDPNNSYIVTGGTNFGVEKTMHEAVNRRNNREGDQLVVLGTFVKEAITDIDKRKELNECKEKRLKKEVPLEERILAQEMVEKLEAELEDGIEPNTVTHATILEIEGKVAETWKQLPETQLEYASKNNGILIAISGGTTVSDMIQAGYNRGIDMLIMDGPIGASTDKSKSLGEKQYSFKTIQELIYKLHKKNSNLFMKNFSLEEINNYIAQAKEDLRSRNYGLEHIAKIDEKIKTQDRQDEIIILDREMYELENDIKRENNDKSEVEI